MRETIGYTRVAMSRTKKLVILCVVVVVLGAVLYFTPPHAQNSSELTIQAWSDASYSFGSSKWLFLYYPSFGSSHELYFSFPFPFFLIISSEAERLHGQPVLETACTTVGQNETEGRRLIATGGASYTWSGLEIIVSEANPAYVVLLFKPLS